jgi:hypothetical protein
MTDATDLNFLIGETDAQVWAREFVKIARENPKIPVDEGTMIGWFANAIMSGYDEGVRYERGRDFVEKLREVIYQAAGAATGPLLEDHPDYVFPSERVLVEVGRVCREFGIPTDDPRDDVDASLSAASNEVAKSEQAEYTSPREQGYAVDAPPTAES